MALRVLSTSITIINRISNVRTIVSSASDVSEIGSIDIGDRIGFAKNANVLNNIGIARATSNSINSRATKTGVGITKASRTNSIGNEFDANRTNHD